MGGEHPRVVLGQPNLWDLPRITNSGIVFLPIYGIFILELWGALEMSIGGGPTKKMPKFSIVIFFREANKLSLA